MADAYHQFAHIFWRAFVCSYTFLGTSPGGLLAQVITIGITEVPGGWWKLSTWRENWEGGLKRIAYALVGVWAITFVVCSVTTIRDDHRNLAGRLRGVVNEKDALKAGLATRDVTISRLTEEKTRLQENVQRLQSANSSRSSATKSPESAIPSTPPPLLANVRIASQKTIVSTNRDFPYALEVILQTDTNIEPVAFAIECNGDIGSANAGFTQGGVYSQVKSGTLNNKANMFGFEWESPAFTPDKPIEITIFSKTYIRVTKLERLQYSWP